MWFLLGAAAGALALFVYQQRQAIAFAAAHKDQIGAASDVVSGGQQAWAGIEKLLGR
jgi:hypothetical protein